MKKIILALFIIMIPGCFYTIDQARNENDRTFRQDVLLDIWFAQQFLPIGECDAKSRKERCNDNYRQLCNARGQWENYESCGAKVCTAPADQDLTICQ
jgi:hypothetical protein